VSKKKVLLIDDEADLLKALTVRIEAEGYEVVTAQDGFDGLNKARMLNPDLIILDLMLPKLNGFKVARFLKFDDRYKKIPIIILTARVQEEDKKLGQEIGSDLYITKPFNTDALLSAIAQFV